LSYNEGQLHEKWIKGLRFMPVTLRLEENQRIMFWQFIDPWTLPELLAHYKESETIFKNATHLVHSLVDLQQARGLPSGILKARYNADWSHPRSGYTVVIGSSLLVKRTAELLFKITRFDRVKFFPDEPSARVYLDTLIATEIASEEAALNPADSA
jgi:hypothetical protein